jgi:hypothetical protein
MSLGWPVAVEYVAACPSCGRDARWRSRPRGFTMGDVFVCAPSFTIACPCEELTG